MAIFFVAAVVLVAGLFAVPVIEEAQAKKGEANEHISSEGRGHQSTEGAINSGVGSSHPLCKVGDPPPCPQFP